MTALSEISIDEFTHAMEFVDQAFKKPDNKFLLFLDHANKDCKLAEGLLQTMLELTWNNQIEKYKKAFCYYKTILAIWIILNEPECNICKIN